MKRMLLSGIVLAALGMNVQAAVFQVTGASAVGKPGDQVFVDLTYDYGTGFEVIVEDLQFVYQFANMTFVPSASTIDVSGTAQSLSDYASALLQFAQSHSGNVLVNLDLAPGDPTLKGYALSFFTADGTGQVRSGLVHLDLAFDIRPTAQPGTQRVSFITAHNGLVDASFNQYTYPSALQNLSVTVEAVPEPQGVLMLLLGLAVAGIVRRRTGQRPG
jgi:hypothetical protein